jgi:phytoene dehydrogenase-like protein
VNGYATAAEELEVGFVAVSAPIHSVSGEVVAAIGVGGPKSRLSSGTIGEIAGNAGRRRCGFESLGWRARAEETGTCNEAAMTAYDVVVIGGGHNGLVAAAYLARAGRRVLVLERRHLLGGASVTEQIFPGFQFSVFSYVVSLMRPEIIRELDLPRHGLEILPLDGTFTPMLNGDHLWRMNDHAKSRREIARHSRLDAEAYDEYGKAMVEMGRFVKPLLAMTPPDPMSLGLSAMKDLFRLGRRFRRLSHDDKYNLVQLMTMSAVDLLDQWFETDVLKATMSASGIIGTFLGVRSPGTAYVLLHHYMGEIDGAFRSWGLPRGGTGAISNAIAAAAREAGVEIRTEAPIAKILLRNGRATGVMLENGDEIVAKIVASSVDPRLTFVKMVGKEHLPGDFVEDIDRYKFRGSSGKVNLALDALPDFKSLPGPGPHLRGAISDLAERRLHGARIRRCEIRPVLAASLRRHRDPKPHRPVGRAPGQARHVVLRSVRPLPPEGGQLGRRAGGVRRRGRRHDRRARAEPEEHHPPSPGADAARYRATDGA